MRYYLALMLMLLMPAAPATAQWSLGFSNANMSIGINLPFYPDLEPVPGYPVYYAPQLDSNYFFYDGVYWVFQGDSWYASSWYNGPWQLVDPDAVPLYLLRIPVRYYRQPPPFFLGWRSDAPPLWGQHWGNQWSQHHSGWDQWNRRSAPAAAPLPAYQRQYSGASYPSAVQQQTLQGKQYRYQPRDPIVRQHVKTSRPQAAPTTAPSPRGNQNSPQDERRAGPANDQRANPSVSPPHGAPAVSQIPTVQPRPAAKRRAPKPTQPQQAAPQSQSDSPRNDQQAAPQSREAPPANERNQRSGRDKEREQGGDERGGDERGRGR